MNPKPFVRLAKPRVVDRPDFPPDLARFYAENEAVEFAAEESYSISLCPLDEVKRIGWEGLFPGDCPEGWERFDALHIGAGWFGDAIMYVLDAPCCERGAIFAFGTNLAGWGGGGTGPFVMEACLVLGASLSEWLRHLEEEGWCERAVSFGIPELPPDRQRRLRAYYLALNPDIDWPEP